MPKTRASAVGLVGIATGTYTGDGAATQAIVGVGFQPKFVIVYEQRVLQPPCYKSDQDGLLALFWNFGLGRWIYLPDHIISLDADGFTVGDGTGLWNLYNILDAVYSYACFG